MKSHIGRLVVAVSLGAVALSAIARADSFTPQHLFTLPYGSGPGQIGVWLPPEGAEEGPPGGPTGIAVGPDGTIYIADSINKRILRFSPSGELLMEAKGPVHRKAEHVAAEEARGWGAEYPRQLKELESIQYIAVDSQGDVYVLFGAAMGLLAKFAADGQGLWYMAIADELPLDVMRTYGGSYGDPSIGPGDSLCIRIRGRGVASLDADGRFLTAVNGHACTPNGRVAAFETARGALATAMRMYDADGVELAYVVADPVAADPALFAGMDGLSGTAFDGMDNLYKFAIGVRDQPIKLSSQLMIGCDEVAVRFDHSGRATAGVRFPGSPFPSPGYRTVDPFGNIYRMAFGADSVEVVAYVLDTSTREYSSLRED